MAKAVAVEDGRRSGLSVCRLLRASPMESLVTPLQARSHQIDRLSGPHRGVTLRLDPAAP